MPKKVDSRQRKRRIVVWLSEEEQREILAKSQQANLSRAIVEVARKAA